ncbi:GNAT family N-acetyltransferase [Streptomyces sp. NPDC004042]|uniref:GNAT family N-acetyltransferase n=1 Tax=Streptomyces sp. NPDC004042 TaxID=3154451 RepID=UPI0033B0AF25
MTTIETARLILRRWHDDDVAPMAAVNADPEVMRFIRDGATRDEERTRADIEVWERHWDTYGFGLFAVEVRATGELAGFTGLAVPEYLPEMLPAVEVGWRLGRSVWGRGLATEAARAALRFGFRDRGLAEVISVIQLGNTASERVAAKLGLCPHRTLTSPGSGRTLRIHSLDRAAYDATDARNATGTANAADRADTAG